MPRRSTLSIVASATDDVTAPLKQASDAVVQAAAKIVGADERVIKASQKLSAQIARKQANLKRLTGATEKQADASSGLASITSQLSDRVLLAVDPLRLFGDATRAVSSALTSLKDAQIENIRLAGEQERVERQLFLAIRQRTALSRDDETAIKERASAIQTATGIGDEQVLQIQRQLVLQGVEVSMLDAATRAAVGLATVKDSSLAEATTKVARLMRGEVEVLREAGIEAETASEGFDELVRNFALAEDEARTLTGRLKSLDGRVSDLREGMGEGGNESKELAGLIADLDHGTEILTKRVGGGAKAVDGLVIAMRSAAPTALAMLGSINPLLQPLVALAEVADQAQDKLTDLRKAAEGTFRFDLDVSPGGFDVAAEAAGPGGAARARKRTKQKPSGPPLKRADFVPATQAIREQDEQMQALIDTLADYRLEGIDAVTAVASEFGHAQERMAADAGKFDAAETARKEKQKAQDEAMIDSIAAYGTGIAIGLKNTIVAMVQDTQNAGQIMLGFLGQVANQLIDSLLGIIVRMGVEFFAQKVLETGLDKAFGASKISTSAAVGGAAAAASIAAIPLVGPALAIPAGETMAASILGTFLPQLAFAQGGMVPGVDGGTDTTLAALRPGELVLPPALSQDLLRVAAGRGSTPGGTRHLDGGGGGRVVNLQLNVLSPLGGMTRSQVRRLNQQNVMPALAGLAGRGF